MLLNFEVMNNLLGVGLPVVGGDQSERGTGIEDSVDSLVFGHTARERLVRVVGGEGESRRS